MTAFTPRRGFLMSLAGSSLGFALPRGHVCERHPRPQVHDGPRLRQPRRECAAARGDRAGPSASGSSRWRPDAGFLKSLSDSQLSELRDDLKAKNLVWGAAGLPVDFRGGQASFEKA